MARNCGHNAIENDDDSNSSDRRTRSNEMHVDQPVEQKYERNRPACFNGATPEPALIGLEAEDARSTHVLQTKAKVNEKQTKCGCATTRQPCEDALNVE